MIIENTNVDLAHNHSFCQTLVTGSTGLNVLSLFDGMSCGRLALDRAGIKVENYFASEIDKHAIKVTQHNFPNTIQLGDVTQVKGEDLPNIDLLIGGSPCQNFSFAGKQKGMVTKDNIEITTLYQYIKLKEAGFQFEGQSFLFWEYVRILKECKPKYFLLENVKMAKKWQDLISSILGVEPILINSNLVSAQNRPRLYWTNIPNIELPKDLGISFQDFKEDAPLRPVGNWVFKKWGSKIKLDNLKTLNTNKLNCLTTSKTHSFMYYTNEEKTMYRNLTLNEAKKAQTVPDWYDMSVTTEGNSFHMLGNGWTVDVIAHIFGGLS